MYNGKTGFSMQEKLAKARTNSNILAGQIRVLCEHMPVTRLKWTKAHNTSGVSSISVSIQNLLPTVVKRQHRCFVNTIFLCAEH